MKIENKTNNIHNMSQIYKRKAVIIYELDSFDNCRFNKQMQTDKMKRNHKMKELKDMNKKELLNEISRLNEIHDSLEAINIELVQKLESSSKDGRKSQVLSLLREYQTISILEIASKLNISTKNVSSQLTYLRSDGYQIFTDPNGRKCLFEDKTNDDNSLNEEDSLNEESTTESDSTDEVESTTEDEVKLEDTL